VLNYRSIACCLFIATLPLFHVARSEEIEHLKGKPNILRIVADDMGYSDLGCFGGEIHTPSIDAIAARGVRATNFYVAASCSPTRSMLLSGTDSHIAGIGNMAKWTGPTQRGKPGYEGHLNSRVTSFPRLPNIPAWESLSIEQRKQGSRKMEIYAAMVEYMDNQVGRLIDHLKKVDQYDNTLIIFISDNGAAGEDLAELVSKLAPAAKEWFDNTFDNRLENWGNPKSAIEYGPSWAQVSSVPFRLFKGVVAEGGIRAPLIVSGPGVQHTGTVNHSLLHVMDIMPTFLELAGGLNDSASSAGGGSLIQGKSMWPMLSASKKETRTEDDWLGWELFGNRAIRQGDWKLL
jgi:arylsulfatase A-like enzyme